MCDAMIINTTEGNCKRDMINFFFSLTRLYQIFKKWTFLQTTVVDACSQIRERLAEIKGMGAPNQYGLFLTDDDPKKGVWLDPGRTLEHYLLRDNVSRDWWLSSSSFRISSIVYRHQQVGSDPLPWWMSCPARGIITRLDDYRDWQSRGGRNSMNCTLSNYARVNEPRASW